MRRNCILLLMMLAALVAACGRDEPAVVSGTWADLHAPTTIVDWPLPGLRPDIHMPGLAATPDGRLLLNWLSSRRGRRHVLQFSTYDPAHQRWRGSPFTIAISQHIGNLGSPQMAASRDGALWVQWAQAPATGKGLHTLVVSRSRDGGANWSEPQILHPEEAGAPYGRALLWPHGEHGLGVAWRDGREISQSGAASLRATWLDANARPAPEHALLDARLDVCAPGGAALTSLGPLVAWRRLDKDGNYAIRAARRDTGGWQEPVRVSGEVTSSSCIVNGIDPLVAAHDQTVVLAWSVDDRAAQASLIQMAVSTDAGERFAPAVEIDQGQGVLLPFALAVDAQQAWVLWVRGAGEDAQSLWLSRRSLDLQHEYERREMTRLPESAFTPERGLPQFVLHQGIGYLVWVERGSEGSLLRGVKILADARVD